METARLSRGGEFVLTVSTLQPTESITNHLAQVWAASTGEVLGPGLIISNSAAAAVLSGDGKRLAVYDPETVQTWEILSSKPLSPPMEPAQAVGGALFSPDGHRLATWGGSKVEVWDALTGQSAYPPVEFLAPVKSVEFSPDGLYLAAGCADRYLTKGFAQVWNAATGQTEGPRLWHGDGVACAAFSPDGKRLVTGGEDSVAMIWDVASGRKLLRSPLRHARIVASVAFSPDGKWVVTVCVDGTARVWSAATGDPVTPPLRHLGHPVHATFLPDNRRVVTSDTDGQTWIWELPLDKTPVADLVSLAHFLSGDPATAEGASPDQQLGSLKALRQRLRTNYPAVFTVSPEQVVAWHEFQALESESLGQWSAASFHWQQLLTLRSGDAAFADHLSKAKEHLNEH